MKTEHGQLADHPFVTSPHATLFSMSFPVLLSLIAEPLTGLVDTAFVARLGSESLAALGVGTVALSSIFWAFNFLGIGSQTEVAQAYGRKELKRTAEIGGLAIALSAAIGGLMVLGGLPLVPTVSSVMGAEGAVHDFASQYIRVRLFGAPAVLVSLAIPFSMLLSFTILHALGITLNMVVLFSLTLALGMLVDNAIVIVENIFRYMEQGVPRIQAAMRATGEVAQPVTASTITTVAAFFPLLFWPGIMGEFMRYLPMAVIITLSSSLFVAMVINPALASIFLRLPAGHRFTQIKVSAEEIEKAGEAPIMVKGPMLRAYRRLLDGALNHRLAVLAMAFLAVVVMAMIWYNGIGIEKPVEFFPNIDPQHLC